MGEQGQSSVNASSAALIADPGDASALLDLAVEFSKEARVTGEHGYYYPTVLMLALIAPLPKAESDMMI